MLFVCVFCCGFLYLGFFFVCGVLVFDVFCVVGFVVV